MPKFKYVAVTGDGTEVTGVHEAASRVAAGNMLLERFASVKEVNEAKSLLQFEITKKKVPRKELMHFSRQLSAFLRSGVPVLDSIGVIEGEMTHKVFKKALVDVMDSVRSGSTLTEACRSHPEAFPPVYLSMLGSAELTGKLDTVLDQLSVYIDRDLEARRKVMSALMYPAIVFGLSLITVGVLAGFVLPRFKDFFSSLDAELPLPTRMLLSTTGFFTDFWFLVPLALALLGLAIVLSVKTEKGRSIRDRMTLRVPVIGDLVRHAIIERFCRLLSSMTRAGVPLPDALLVTADGTNNRVYKRGLATAREAMMRGDGLAEPIAATGLFPGAARQMLRVGEETGTLDSQLEAASFYFERELDYKIKRFTTLFEPAMIGFVGLVVGFVAVALVSAMYGIFRQVNV